MTPTTRSCAVCGRLGAGVWLIDDQGRQSEDCYCWTCAEKQATPLPAHGPLLGALAFVDRAWLLTREGAAWLAQRRALTTPEDRDE